MNISEWLFNPSGLTPHGFCLLWVPGLIYLHAISDGIIALAYFSIPLALARFAEQRKDLEYKWVIHLFAAFIMACGTTHILGVVTLWWPVYGIEGVVKAITAVLSIVTAGLLWPLIPKLVALPSPNELRNLNFKLAAQVKEHEVTAEKLRQSESEVRQANAELEQRVQERTAEMLSANEKLTATVTQRDLLLQEVYHRVKNNLQVIDSIVNLQSRKLSDREAQRAFQSLRGRIHALGLVHQQLMGSSDLKTFKVVPFLEELANNLRKSCANDAITISLDSIPLDIGLDTAIPLGLLVTELVTNSLKHAFPNGTGHIAVTLTGRENGKIALLVRDNGCGYDDTPVSSDSKSGGLGHTIIKGLISQLRATMKHQSQAGSVTEIVFPAPA
jgi:two-component sensor histidine kinase